MAYNSKGKQRNRVNQNGTRVGTVTKRELDEDRHSIYQLTESVLLRTDAIIRRMSKVTLVVLIANALTIVSLWGATALTWWLI